MKKSVFSVEVNGAQSKRKVMKGVASLPGIDSLSIDSNKKQLTVVGIVDPVKVVQKLGKKFNAKIETVGQNKKEVKDEEIEKINIERVDRSLFHYHNHGTCYDYGCPRCYPAEDRPSSCVIS